MGNLWLAEVGRPDDRVQATLRRVAAHLDGTPRPLQVPGGLPRSRQLGRFFKQFTATPGPLLESWRVARHLEGLTEPGDLVLITDREGVGGMFALEQAMAPPEERRTVVVTAADGLLLEHMAVAGTHEGMAAEDESAADWELAGYRWAAAVAATSERAVRALESLGLSAQLVGAAEAVEVMAAGLPAVIAVPEPVSRLSQTPAILRAVAAARADLPEDLQVVVGSEDRPDRIWSGTTWEAMEGIRAVLGEVVRRGEVENPDLVVLGDPYAEPGNLVEDYAGRTVLMVAEGSTASVRWPDALVWKDEGDLAGLLRGAARERAPGPEPGPVLLRPGLFDPDRARRVSVGVPIFRDVRFLDACLESVVSQTQPPHEIVLVDDGSESPKVDRALQTWAERHPNLVQVLRQSNRGVCVARNRALENMTGDAFVLVDQDDQLAPTFIADTAAALRSAPDLWAVATWTEFFGEYQAVEAKPPFDRRVGRRENPIVSTCSLVDMVVRDKGIRFEPDLAWIYCEDWDFWAQIVAAGGSFGLVPRPLARHRVIHSSGGFRRTDEALRIGRARARDRLVPSHHRSRGGG